MTGAPTARRPLGGTALIAGLIAGFFCLAGVAPLAGQTPTPPAPPAPPALMPIEFERSAEFGWLNKPVLASRVLDDMTDPATWTFRGTGTLTFPAGTAPGGGGFLRVDMRMFDGPAPTRNRLSTVSLRRPFEGEDWSGYNRLSLWIRPDIAGFPMLPLQIVLHNDGDVPVPDAYGREGVHYVTLADGVWQRVVWEIEPLARDRVTAISFGYWVNKMIADAGDRVAFEIANLELQRVEPDHYAGWGVAPGSIAFSHSGYHAGASKTALASDLDAAEFAVIRVDDNAMAEAVLVAPVRRVTTRLGAFQVLDFSAVREPGRYVIRAGDRMTRPFAIDDDPWRASVFKALNFFFGQRCGHPVPGSHGVCHTDWLATFGDRSIVMNGGWHDAGDLSQGAVNTGEAVYSMFALAERLQRTGEDPELLERLLDEARWGLDWLLRVRFEGGRRIGFAGNNLWTNGVIGDADDRSREALDNPNVNYIAAAATAIAARVLEDVDPDLAGRSLRVAEDDWRHAIVGIEGPETWSTPAFAASPMELASIGALASMELYAATGESMYAEKAIELARTIVASQQRTPVGTDLPLVGFFHTGPDQDTLFHQFHRGNDQAPMVALAHLIRAFPDHPEWMDWYATVALYGEYQKAVARTTAPWHVLPAYIYRDTDYRRMPATLNRYQASPEAYRAQVLEGMPIGDGYYLRAFPVWFARRGNYGVLLAQAKALATAAAVRRDTAAAELAQRQAQWIVGRNPFVQSTMYGEGYDWAQQYSVSSGDFVGSLPVGMQSHGLRDVPYWPAQNTYTYKEVWVHSTSRWIWLMADLKDAPMEHAEHGVAGHAVVDDSFSVLAEAGADGVVTIEVAARGDGERSFEVRASNLQVDAPVRTMTVRAGRTAYAQWRGRVVSADRPWVVVVVPDGDVERRREVTGTRTQPTSDTP